MHSGVSIFRVSTFIVLTIGLAACTRQSGDVEFADTVLKNGKIYTVNPAQNWVEAVAIRNGKYSYVGGDEGAASYSG